MKNLIRSLFDLLFPPSCLGCGQDLEISSRFLFCATCLARLRFITTPLCPACGRAFLKAAGGDHFCATCLTRKWHFSAARGVVLYEEPITTVLHRFKYQGRMECLKSLAGLTELLPHLAWLAANAHLILPVPLHRSRLRQRGFNQALLLALALFPGDHRLRSDILHRVRATQPQTGLSGGERRRNLKNAFTVGNAEDVRGRTVLLVDDVFTTGSTVNECAKTLRKAGAAEVRVLTLARVRED